MRQHIGPLLAVASLIFVAISWGQTEVIPTPPPAQVSSGNIPASAFLSERGPELERELNRLRDARASMGEAHPSLANVEKRIRELEVELEAFRSIPNPFAQFENEGLGPAEMLDRLSADDLKVLVVRLSVDMKDLRKRMAKLEKAALSPLRMTPQMSSPSRRRFPPR